MSETREVTALAVGDPGAVPSPIFRGAHMVKALSDYRELQKALDEAMPEQLMTLDGRPFRKKGYWRAIAVAFNLTVEPVPESEQRTSIGSLSNGDENYLYVVTYRAAAPSGRSATGDGACAAAEKQRGRMVASEHNVRSHAHTRAFNRSVSNLVGFGEVSAEEVEREEHGEAPIPARADGATRVTGVEEKKKTGKRWTRYVVTFEDGRVASTFDAKLGAEARRLCEAKILTVPTLVKSGDFLNLEGFLAVAPEPDSAPVGEATNGGATTNGETGEVINEKQVRLFTAIAAGHGWNAGAIKALLKEHGVETPAGVLKSRFESVTQRLKKGPGNA